jgi:cellulose synthase/poly-beta-1,6-N-acetylglucosamine synthase-like glycosyltransferase
MTHAGAPEIDVVIPVYNKLPFLLEAVGSVIRAADFYGRAQVWLVDNGSSDGSYELLVDRFGNRGNVLRLTSGSISAVRNFGANLGKAPIISFIDCDCVVPTDYFQRLAAVLADTCVDATGCKVSLPRNPGWIETVWNQMHDDGANGLRLWINSANFAVRRRLFDQIGGFNERLVTGEDTEICLRIREHGGRLLEDRRLAVAHLDNPKTLMAFFRKERWHALGMLGTVKRGSLDRPTAMMAAHVLALSAALSLAWIPSTSSARAAAGLVLTFLVPAATVAYRRKHSIQPFATFPAIVLYQLYYLARIAAFFSIGGDAARAWIFRSRGLPNGG